MKCVYEMNKRELVDECLVLRIALEAFSSGDFDFRDCKLIADYALFCNLERSSILMNRFINLYKGDVAHE